MGLVLHNASINLGRCPLARRSFMTFQRLALSPPPKWEPYFCVKNEVGQNQRPKRQTMEVVSSFYTRFKLLVVIHLKKLLPTLRRSIIGHGVSRS
jgi:hypothetical protein